MNLRTKKKKLVELFKEQVNILKTIQTEIPENHKIFPKEMPAIDDKVEFPEMIFFQNIKNDTENNTSDDTDNDEINPDIYQKTSLEIADIISKQDFSGESLFSSRKRDSNSSYILNECKSITNDRNVSTWEFEQRQLRFLLNIFKQEHIVVNLNKLIDEFNQDLQNLKENRLETDVNQTFFEIYLLTLCQELWILKDFEKVIEIKYDTLMEQLMQRNEFENKTKDCQSQIEESRHHIDSLVEDEKIIQQNFLHHCSNNKFSNFFRRIFKKKYKAPKVYASDEDPSSSSSSDSSSSEDEADAASLDSLDMGNVRLDESVCPPGCDRNLYDLSFDLRNQRHLIEQSIKSEELKIELNRKEIDSFAKEISLVNADIAVIKSELDDLRVI